MPHNPACIYQLFLLYAKWSPGGNSCGIPSDEVGRMMFDLDLLAGVPADRYSAYLREHILRADQDHDGLLSLNEFMIWFFSELAAIIPIGPHGASQRGCAPMYNQYVYYMRIGPGVGSRKGATALQEGQFIKMCRDNGILQRSSQHGSVLVARSQASHQRKTSQLEAGSKLQLARLLSSLFSMAASLSLNMDAILYRLVSGGDTAEQHPSPSSQPDVREVVEAVRACYLGGEGFMPGVTEYGKEFHTSEHYNKLRSTFHQYNLRVNTGLPPPRRARPAWASFGAQEWEDEAPASPAGAAGQQEDGSAGASDSPSPECCCMYRTLTLMELQTWRKVCADCSVIQLTMEDSNSQLTPQRIETAFLVACSVGGLGSHDSSLSTHDKPVPGMSASSPRSLAPTTNKIGPRPSSAFGTPFTLSSTSAACAQRTVQTSASYGAATGSSGGAASPSSPRVSSPRPQSAASSPRGAGGGSKHAHRAAVPTLNFLQFLEALRLVAVYIIGSDTERTFYAPGDAFRSNTSQTRASLDSLGVSSQQRASMCQSSRGATASSPRGRTRCNDWQDVLGCIVRTLSQEPIPW